MNFSFEDLGYFVAGLIEGDGCFSYDRLRIMYHLNDLGAAEELQKRLGFGRINRLKGQQAINLQMATKTGLRAVLNLIHGKFAGSAKLQQLIKQNYEERFQRTLLPPWKK